jgi:hypothetical protein
MGLSKFLIVHNGTAASKTFKAFLRYLRKYKCNQKRTCGGENLRSRDEEIRQSNCNNCINCSADLCAIWLLYIYLHIRAYILAYNLYSPQTDHFERKTEKAFDSTLNPVVEDLGVVFRLQQQNIVGHRGILQATLAGVQEHVSKLGVMSSQSANVVTFVWPPVHKKLSQRPIQRL